MTTKKKTKIQKVPVSDRALLARINRKLAAGDEVLKRCREDSRSYYQLGDYYLVDLNSNGIVRMNCDLEVEGRKLGVLNKWEVLAE